LRGGVPNKNTVARLTSNIFPQKKIWAGYATDRGSMKKTPDASG